jgi:hypothetical protein
VSDEATDCKRLIDAMVQQFAGMHVLVDSFTTPAEKFGEREKERSLYQNVDRCHGIVQDWLKDDKDAERAMTIDEVGVRVGRALCEDLLRRIDEALSPEEGERLMNDAASIADATTNAIVTEATRLCTPAAADRSRGLASNPAKFSDIAQGTGASLDDIEATFTGRDGFVLNNTDADKANWYVEIEKAD